MYLFVASEKQIQTVLADLEDDIDTAGCAQSAALLLGAKIFAENMLCKMRKFGDWNAEQMLNRKIYDRSEFGVNPNPLVDLSVIDNKKEG